MEFNIKNTMLFLSLFTTALSAGLFYAWVVSVIPGTKKIPDQAYLETMQSINREILNAGFFFIFFGALFFAIGTIGVTMFGNVPLNNMVEALDLSAFTEEDYRKARLAYEGKWNLLNLIRTLAALGAFVLLLLAKIKF